MRTVISISLGVLISLFSSHALAQSAVYKWVDERGVSQYTQTPPVGRNYETVRMGSGGQRTAEPEPAAAPARQAAASTVSSAADQERQEYCDAARRNLETLQSDQAVMMAAEEGGERAELNEAQRAEQMQVAQRQVTLFCRD